MNIRRRSRFSGGYFTAIKFLSLFAAVVLAALVLLPAPAAEAYCKDNYMFGVSRNDPVNPTDSAVYRTDNSGNLTIVSASLGFPTDAVARDPVNCRRLFMISSNFATPESQHMLYRFSLSSGSATLVGATGLSPTTNVDRLTFGPDGTLYALQDNQMFTVNTVTGAASLIGAVAGWSAGDGGDIAISPEGIMWGVRQNQIFRINNYTTAPSAAQVCTGVSLPSSMEGLGVNSNGFLQIFAWEGASRTMILVDPNVAGCQINIPPFPISHDGTHMCDLTSAQDARNPTAISLLQMEVGSSQAAVWLVALLALTFVTLVYVSRRQREQELLA